MMSNAKRLLLVLGAAVLLGVPALAQERKGGIRGHVTDNSGGVLQGARIELQPKGIIVVSNTQGEFFINDVEPGSFTISITYVGFNGVTINGINVPSPESGVRQSKLDAIPADIVESVEINKTLQANMDADGIGGSVNLVTKTAGERPTITLNGMSGYTPIVNGRGLVETAATMGQRFGSDKRFGALIGGTYDWNGRGIDDIEPVPDIASLLPGRPRWFDTIDQREYRYYRSRWGLAGSTDYKLAEGSNIYLRGFYSTSRISVIAGCTR